MARHLTRRQLERGKSLGSSLVAAMSCCFRVWFDLVASLENIERRSVGVIGKSLFAVWISQEK